MVSLGNSFGECHMQIFIYRNKSNTLNYIHINCGINIEFYKMFSDLLLCENELTFVQSLLSMNIDSVNEEVQVEVIELQ